MSNKRHYFAILRFSPGCTPEATTGCLTAKSIMRKLVQATKAAKFTVPHRVILYAQNGLDIVNVRLEDGEWVYVPVCHPNMTGATAQMYEDFGNGWDAFRKEMER